MQIQDFALTGKVALVTGGGSGVGQMMAHALACAGAFVWIINRSDANDAMDAIQKDGGKAQFYAADVTDETAMEQALQQIQQQSGTIDILVNAAGINPRLPADKMSTEVWEYTLKLNLSVPYQLSQLLAPAMAAQGFGRIINIASLQSYRAFANSIPYGASKGGVVQLTRALAQAYSPQGVLVNAIAPGFFHTKLTEPVFQDPKKAQEMADKTMMGRNGEAYDLFGLTVFLASAANSYVTGQTIALDGGFSAQ